MIRQATRGDIPRIKGLMQSEPGLWQDSWCDDVLDVAIESAAGLGLVWEEAGRILGFVCAHDLGFRGYLSELVVAGSARSRGIGKSLVRHVEQELASRGRGVLIADVWQDAQRFYRSLGWSEPEVVLLRKKLEQETD